MLFFTWAALLNTPPVADIMISSRDLPCSSVFAEMAALSFVTSKAAADEVTHEKYINKKGRSQNMHEAVGTRGKRG